MFPTFIEKGQNSLPYVSIGLIIVLYNISLVWRFKCGEFSYLYNLQLVLLALIIRCFISVVISLSSVKIVPR